MRLSNVRRKVRTSHFLTFSRIIKKRSGAANESDKAIFNISPFNNFSNKIVFTRNITKNISI